MFYKNVDNTLFLHMHRLILLPEAVPRWIRRNPSQEDAFRYDKQSQSSEALNLAGSKKRKVNQLTKLLLTLLYYYYTLKTIAGARIEWNNNWSCKKSHSIRAKLKQ